MRDRAGALLHELGLPTEIPAGIGIGALQEAMARDKKALRKAPRFVVLEDIGRAHVAGDEHTVPVPVEIVHDVLRDLGAAPDVGTGP